MVVVLWKGRFAREKEKDSCQAMQRQGQQHKTSRVADAGGGDEEAEHDAADEQSRRRLEGDEDDDACHAHAEAVSYTHLTLPTMAVV